MDDLKELIERVEKSTGLDIELDYLILRHLAGGADRNFIYWPVTVSVDAVIALIGEKMPGVEWEIIHGENSSFEALVYVSHQWGFGGEAPTPALALLLAFLRAWEAKDDG